MPCHDQLAFRPEGRFPSGRNAETGAVSRAARRSPFGLRPFCYCTATGQFFNSTASLGRGLLRSMRRARKSAGRGVERMGALAARSWRPQAIIALLASDCAPLDGAGARILRSADGGCLCPSVALCHALQAHPLPQQHPGQPSAAAQRHAPSARTGATKFSRMACEGPQSSRPPPARPS